MSPEERIADLEAEVVEWKKRAEGGLTTADYRELHALRAASAAIRAECAKFVGYVGGGIYTQGKAEMATAVVALLEPAAPPDPESETP